LVKEKNITAVFFHICLNFGTYFAYSFYFSLRQKTPFKESDAESE